MTTTPAQPAPPTLPAVIGETAKTLDAALRQLLAETGLTEEQWVVLRIAEQAAGDDGDGLADNRSLAARAADRARFENTVELVDQLAAKGLVADGQPTGQGWAVLADTHHRSAARVGPIWESLAADDVEVVTRVLNEVRDRVREVLV